MPRLGEQQPSGSYVGNGTSLEITLGFKPVKVRIVNWTLDGSVEVLKLEGMESDTAQVNKQNKGKILSGGVTLLEDGFVVGNSQYVNKNGETFLWEAF
jgi:hypothetical protein